MATEPEREAPAAITEDDERDELDDLIAEGAREDPNFPARVEAALQRRLAAITRGEDPNDIPWDDDEDEAPEDAPQQPTATSR